MFSSKLLLLAAIPMLHSCGVVATGIAVSNVGSIAEINRRLTDFELMEMESDVGQHMRQEDTETITVDDTVYYNGKPRQTRSDSYAVIAPAHKHAGVLLQLASTRKSFQMIPEKFSHLMRVAPLHEGRYVFHAPAGDYSLLIVNNRLATTASSAGVQRSHYIAAIRTSAARNPHPTYRRSNDNWSLSAEQTTKLFAELPDLLPPPRQNWQHMK